MTAMNYIAGRKSTCDVRLREAGFQRVSNDTWRKEDLAVRWVASPGHLRGIDGSGRQLIVFEDAPDGMALEGRVQRFEVVHHIE